MLGLCPCELNAEPAGIQLVLLQDNSNLADGITPVVNED